MSIKTDHQVTNNTKAIAEMLERLERAEAEIERLKLKHDPQKIVKNARIKRS